MSRNYTLGFTVVVLAASLFFSPASSLAQSEPGQSTAQQAPAPPGVPSIVIACNGGNTSLGLGGAVGVKLTFVLNYPNSGCPIFLKCIDLVTQDTFIAPPGTGPAVFGCATGRIQLIAGSGGGFARVYIGGAD